MDEVIKQRWACSRFRILIIGRANSGKTTILQKICNTTKQPAIFRNGKKVSDNSILAPTAGVGISNIEDELIFSSNPDFVFHDSPGFESGSRKQVEIVKDFIAKRAQATKLDDQLHVIWYCLPTDNARPFPASEKEFFNECGTGKGMKLAMGNTITHLWAVPVIAIFTKYDGLIVKAYALLRDEGLDWKRARAGEDAQADAMFQENYLRPLYQTRYPPADHLRLGNMHKANIKCPELVDKTANSLTDTVLKMLFVSVQQKNLDTNATYAIDWGILHICNGIFQDKTPDMQKFVESLLAWFPHVWASCP